MLIGLGCGVEREGNVIIYRRKDESRRNVRILSDVLTTIRPFVCVLEGAMLQSCNRLSYNLYECVIVYLFFLWLCF